MKKHKYSGTDGITNEMIIYGREHLYGAILTIFNNILDTSIYPTDWHTNIIVPIFKSGSKNDTNNYRGISLSSCLSKLFTQIINWRIEKYLKDNNIIATNQNGFKRGHRTEDNIIYIEVHI